MNLHVFVAMPIGTKDGIDFNSVYKDLVQPALASEGLELFRADQETRAGEIRPEMFQELLLADLVVVDLSIDNPNVWYQLGVRHALRSRGVILINCKPDCMPFDVYTDRTLSYHLKDGLPDPQTLEADKKALARLAVQTCNAWHRYKVSPVYQLLPCLQEPDWKTLCVKESGEHWERQKLWEQRIEVARRNGRPGDILLLADEAPNYALLREAQCAAGTALLKMGQFRFALEQFNKVLELNPEDPEALRVKAIVLGRLQQHREAKDVLRSLLKRKPDDDRSVALLGGIEKDEWVNRWRKEGSTPDEMKRDAAAEAGLLREAFAAYRDGFVSNPAYYRSGINALTLLHLLGHLFPSDADPAKAKEIEGGVRWSIRSALVRESVDRKDFRARATLGHLELLVSEVPVVERAYRHAVAAAEAGRFDLDGTRRQLLLLRDLDFRPAQVTAALDILNGAIDKLKEPWQPRKVFLFSGHMIDAPGRPEPRFPPDKEPVAVQAIAGKLDELQAGEGDLALCSGACGGDLIFAEQCLKRGMRLHLRIPFPEPQFLEASVNFAGDKWRERFREVKEQPHTRLIIMPEELGPAPENVDPYERCNQWLLYSALIWGPEKINFLTLWNRREGDGRGGTKHMLDAVKERSGATHILDTTKLW